MKATEWTRRVPWSIVGASLGLMLLGLSGIARGDELSAAGSFFEKQAVWIALSLPAMFAATLFSYRKLRWVSAPLFAVSLVLLVVVFFLPARNGSQKENDNQQHQADG